MLKDLLTIVCLGRRDLQQNAARDMIDGFLAQQDGLMRAERPCQERGKKKAYDSSFGSWVTYNASVDSQPATTHVFLSNLCDQLFVDGILQLCMEMDLVAGHVMGVIGRLWMKAGSIQSTSTLTEK